MPSVFTTREMSAVAAGAAWTAYLGRFFFFAFAAAGSDDGNSYHQRDERPYATSVTLVYVHRPEIHIVPVSVCRFATAVRARTSPSLKALRA